MLYLPLFSPISPTFGTKTLKCRRYGITIIYRSTQKIAAEVAASAKNIFISIHRTSRAIKHKSAATLFTFAATFCSFIIETQILETQKPQKAHRSPIDVLWWSRNLQETC